MIFNFCETTYLRVFDVTFPTRDEVYTPMFEIYMQFITSKIIKYKKTVWVLFTFQCFLICYINKKNILKIDELIVEPCIGLNWKAVYYYGRTFAARQQNTNDSDKQRIAARATRSAEGQEFSHPADNEELASGFLFENKGMLGFLCSLWWGFLKMAMPVRIDNRS